jgi:AraC-like DNA-binding protein
MSALVRLLAVELEPRTIPHVSVVDLRRVESVDPGAFQVLQGYVTANHAALKRQVTRLALARPAGLAGAVVSGFFQVMESPYPTAVFPTLEEAATWIDAPASHAAEIDGLVAQVSGVDALRTQLRALIVERGGRLEVGDAAKSLGVSHRTLQRRLSDQGTTFVAEVSSVRLDIARERLRASQSPLTVIAIDAGFSSLQHFSAAFRKAFGVSPSTWRGTQLHA